MIEQGTWTANPVKKIVIVYDTIDGRKFTNKEVAESHDRIAHRQRYYNLKMENRNWFMRLFNIKPSMKSYDERH